MDNKLSTWLAKKHQDEKWSFRAISKESGISHTSIADVVNGKRAPTLAFCDAIAPVFDKEPMELYRMAGLLPPISESVAEEEEMLRLFRQLPHTARIVVIRVLRAINEVAKETPSGVIVVTTPPEDTSAEAHKRLFDQIWNGASTAERNAIVQFVLEETEGKE